MYENLIRLLTTNSAERKRWRLKKLTMQLIRQLRSYKRQKFMSDVKTAIDFKDGDEEEFPMKY